MTDPLSPTPERFTFLARVRREAITGAVSLDLFRPDDPVELDQGDEFITVNLRVDPFQEVP